MRISDWSSDVCSSDLADPARLVELFQLADLYGLEIHPLAMRAAARDAKLVDDIRREPRANAFFLDVLTSPRDPETVLRWMNEAGVFGRLVPDFGRVVAQMQRSEEHTSELQSLMRISYAVFCLKKKNN